MSWLHGSKTCPRKSPTSTPAHGIFIDELKTQRTIETDKYRATNREHSILFVVFLCVLCASVVQFYEGGSQQFLDRLAFAENRQRPAGAIAIGTVHVDTEAVIDRREQAV